jgi:hypothetical protein
MRQLTSYHIVASSMKSKKHVADSHASGYKGMKKERSDIYDRVRRQQHIAYTIEVSSSRTGKNLVQHNKVKSVKKPRKEKRIEDASKYQYKYLDGAKIIKQLPAIGSTHVLWLRAQRERDGSYVYKRKEVQITSSYRGSDFYGKPVIMGKILDKDYTHMPLFHYNRTNEVYDMNYEQKW